MGQSLPPPATLDLVGSFARRNGASVDLLLARSDLPGSTGPLVVELSKGSQSVSGTAQVHTVSEGSDVRASVPASALGDGVWTIQLGVLGEDERVPVTARLLVQGQRPVVLLWGEKTKKSVLPTKRPAGAVGLRAAGGASVARRAAVTGGKALDRGLKVLPDEQAAKVRTTLRTVARKVLP